MVTDPPYESLQIHRARGTTTRLTTNWFTTVPNERLPELLREVYRVLRSDRHFYLFCDEVTADIIKQQQGIGAARLVNGARKCASGFVYWKEIVWAKTTLDGARIRGGTGYHYRAASERILFFEKGKRALSDLGIPDVLMAARAGVPGPAVKPGAVVRTLIAQSTSPEELVVDPFCGSGVTGVEARGLHRREIPPRSGPRSWRRGTPSWLEPRRWSPSRSSLRSWKRWLTAAPRPTSSTQRAPAAGSTPTARRRSWTSSWRCGPSSARRPCGARCGQKLRGRGSRIACAPGGPGR